MVEARLLLERIDPVGETFPQEINDGNHKQIVVEFQTSIDLSRYPLKLTIGTHGRTGLARFFLGSVAARVAALASCPVLIVRGR